MIKEPDLFIAIGHTDRDATRQLNELFHDAARRRVSDVHLLFQEGRCQICFRAGGVLEEVVVVDAQTAKQYDEKIRARSQMSQADRHRSLDGRMRLRYVDRSIDVRVSVIPVVGGQKIVCRLLDQANAAMDMNSIRMTSMTRYYLEELIEEPQGLLLVCGPTGSGKTTTLYGLLGALNDGKRNLMTIENPVEYVIPGIGQVNIDQHVSFPDALRAILRQDPDVILVGEIRDAETAKIAVSAANTGHLVLSTLHANNSALALTRLIELGVDPQTLAAALRGVLAQRLVPTIDEHDGFEWEFPTEFDGAWLGLHGIDAQGLCFPKLDRGQQFTGKTPVIEMVKADKAVRAAIVSGRGEQPIFNAAARQMQFETLAQAGVRLANEGVTTMEQVRKIVGQDAILPEVKRLGEVLVASRAAELGQITAALDIQVRRYKQGRLTRLGEILIEEGICSIQQVVDALGMTEGAPDLAYFFVVHAKLSDKDLKATVQEWKTQTKRESLFGMLLNKNLITQEDLYEPSFVSCAGRCTTCDAGRCQRAEERIAFREDAVSGSAVAVV
ncbi:GspE/PulE family protein [Noviherbaspirillum suwonense]|uniref:General secretion pathway protein E n=1 Tax=Noviherbaspirillum suwonense TaxID=1224511 RepID=A0ABY1QLY1_9BURK|nr:ATPase, T2SS/T4P/T4SS family [Noviherbaspirillum suwonense]SMP72588.1 general secretion pathway protein E [Noviherbaspirillum suwonense]